jgi:hypothetical protein
MVAIDRLKAFLDDPEGTRKQLNDAFVARELEQSQHLFETVQRQPLTPCSAWRVWCLKHHTTLIETYSYQFRDGRLFDELARQLREYAVVFQPQSLEEVLAQQADQQRNRTHLARLMGTLLTVFKSSGQDMTEVAARPKRPQMGGAPWRS